MKEFRVQPRPGDPSTSMSAPFPDSTTRGKFVVKEQQRRRVRTSYAWLTVTYSCCQYLALNRMI